MRLIFVLGTGIAFSIILWTLIFLSVFLSSKLDSSGGFFSFHSSNVVDSVKAALAIGVVHGFLIGMGIFWSRPNALLNAILFGLIITEIGLFIAVGLGLWYWGSALYGNDVYLIIVGGFLWFLIFSALFFPPTLLVGYLTAKSQQLIATKDVDAL